MISNTGVFENTRETTRGLKATEIYCAIPSYSGHVFMRLSTINGTLCLTLSYNERVFSNAFVCQLTHAIVHLVNQLCEEEEEETCLCYVTYLFMFKVLVNF